MSWYRKLTGRQKRTVNGIGIAIAILFMAFTQYTKVFLGTNETVNNLQYISSDLVADAMYARQSQAYDGPYGLLGVYRYNGSSDGVLSDENYTDGYNNTENEIAVEKNEFTLPMYIRGNILQFENGARAIINYVRTDDAHIYAKYHFEDGDDAYRGNQGPLQYIQVIDQADGKVLAPGSIEPYVSQLGLQGTIFSALMVGDSVRDAVKGWQGILALLFAVVLVLLSMELGRHYNKVFGVVFYMVTLLSPWVIGFSTNVYWMEVTWFAPMLVGIYCANRVEQRGARIASYVFVFLTVALKCACGYEYITVVMLGAVVFLLADLTMAILRRQKQQAGLLLRTTFFVGVAALMGFVAVILIHGYIRGNGNMVAGIKEIYASDVLRRTLGGQSGNFSDVYAESLEAPIWYVVARYCLFQTPLLLGIPGIAFIPLVILSFSMLVYGVALKKRPGDMMALYVWLGLMCISWFVLGKAHSYIHTFLNFVLWYMGFVQMIFYVPIQTIVDGTKKQIGKRKHNE